VDRRLPYQRQFAGNLYGVLRTKEGELRFEYDNAKDLRQWRVEPQETKPEVLTGLIDASVGYENTLTLIYKGLDDRGIALTEVKWW
jgi:hypothetical protein